MANKQDWLCPRRHGRHLSLCHHDLFQTSLPLKKPQRFLSSVKDLLHRKTRSVGEIRSSGHPRSKSLDTVERPSAWKPPGQAPGMDDYLTLAELEIVWVTQDTYVGSVGAPQEITGYTYIGPVEAPTFIKHQIQPEITRQSLPILQRIPTDSVPFPKPSECGKDSVVKDASHPWLQPRHAPNSRSSSSYTPPMPVQGSPSPLSVTEVRNAVVSGIVHPAFRPTPYFSTKDTLPNCQITSRFAVDVPSSNWTSGKL